MSTPLSAEAALDRYFLETRCRIIEIAANLDRIDRGAAAAEVAGDARLARIREAVKVLLGDGPDRAERCQQVFSVPYEADWSAPNAK